MTNYFIRIESQADGVILETETTAFLLAYDASDDPEVREMGSRGRGLNPYEVAGVMDWLKEAHIQELVADSFSSPPLIDELADE